MSWHAYLVGQEFDLDLLVEQFNRGSVIVRHDGHDYWIESPDFETLTEPREVANAATIFLSKMNGAAALVHQRYRPVKLSNQFRDNAGRNLLMTTASFSAQARLTAATPILLRPDGEVVQPAPPTPGSEYIAAAHRHPVVQEALELLSQGPRDWVSLYKVFEIIRADGGHTRWASEADYKAFTNSANLPSVSGAQARHARQPPGRSSTPKRTMSIQEAQDFIRLVTIKWIRSK